METVPEPWDSVTTLIQNNVSHIRHARNMPDGDPLVYCVVCGECDVQGTPAWLMRMTGCVCMKNLHPPTPAATQTAHAVAG